MIYYCKECGCLLEKFEGVWVEDDVYCRECGEVFVAGLMAEVERLRARCERRDGDPSVEEMRRWVMSDQVAPSLRDIARVALRAWGVEVKDVPYNPEVV